MIKPRRPFLAFFLSLCAIGLGQFYNGETKKAGIFVVLFYIVPFALGIAFLDSVIGVGLLFGIFLLVFIYSLIDAFIVAKKQKDYTLRAYNRWFFYIFFWILVSLVIGTGIPGLYKTYCHEAFKFPSRSMEPTFIPGDYILVKKLWLSGEQIESGDLVLFTLPEAPDVNIVKRVVATAGQTVEVKANKVFIDSQALSEPYAKWEKGGQKSFAAQEVPANSVFVLGDNRDFSRDSRFYSNPFVPVSRIKGKPTFIYWNSYSYSSRMGKRLK